MKPRWMLFALAPIISCPISTYAQYPIPVWYGPCTYSQRQVLDPWGVPLEPGVVSCTPILGCSDSAVQHIVPQTATGTPFSAPVYAAAGDTSPQMLDLQDRVRGLELRVDKLDGLGPKPLGP